MQRLPAAHDQQKLDEFFALCRDYEGAYATQTWASSPCTARTGCSSLRATLSCRLAIRSRPRIEVQTPSICSVRLSELGVDSRDLVTALLDDGLETPVGKLTFGRHAVTTDAASAHLEQFPSNFYTPEVHPLRLTVPARTVNPLSVGLDGRLCTH